MSSVFNLDGSLTESDEAAADTFNYFFASVFTNEDFLSLPNLDPRSDFRCNNLPITEEAVFRVIHKLPRHSSPGPDGISNTFLKEGGPSLILAIAALFRVIMRKGVLPSEWKTATIIPIFKKGSRSQCSSYRPISLTCTLCKVLEHLIKDLMLDFLYTHDLLRRSQHGFLPSRSCCSALLSFLEDVSSSIDDNFFVDVIYLDFSKAFDSIPHRRLLLKLQSFGFGGDLLNWLTCFLTDRTQRVQIGGSLSSSLSVTSGVPQGSVLGPLLFILYIDDIDECVSGSSILKFADDTRLFHAFDTSHTVSLQRNILQDDLSKVTNWCATWLLKLNSAKCACVHFGSKNPGFEYVIGDSPVSRVDGFRDLGVFITKDLKPSTQCLRAAASAQRMLSVIKLAFRHLDVFTITTLYKSFVRPLLEYCSVVWCPFYVKDIDILEGVQRRFTRILPDFRTFPYEDRLTYYKVSSLYARRLCSDLVCVFKIINGHIDIDPATFFDFNVDSRTRGHEFKIKHFRSRLDVRRHWFSSRIVPLWNNLPASCVSCSSVKSFKRQLWQHFSASNIK